MRIVIDLQGAQAASRERGIGRYSLQFAQAVARYAEEHEIFIALNAGFADTIENIRSAFDGLLPQEHIVVWEVPCSIAWVDEANHVRRKVAEQIREAFLASLQPDWIIVASLFEGFTDDVVTSVGIHASLPTAVVLYDLIPLIHAERYLKGNSILDSWYRKKLEHLKRANLLLSISESAGREAIDYLDFKSTSVVPIGTDCDARFQPSKLSDVNIMQFLMRYGVARPFVMYTGGNDYRKNIDGLIRAYASLPPAIRSTHQLVVVCALQPSDLERLVRLARKVGLGEEQLIFTGFVSDDDLLTFYNACKLFVFPSWHEGFGLPVLEAMRCGKAVLAANTSSLPEVIGRNDALFDPFDDGAIAALIQRALTDEAFRQDLERHAFAQSQRFSWEETAKRTLAALGSASLPVSTLSGSKVNSLRPRLAYVSPLPPDKSGIADYSAELLLELTRWYDVEVILAQPELVDSDIRTAYVIRSVDEFRASVSDYDRVLYHFGNSPFHEHMFPLLEEIPGVVVLHGFYLSGIQAQRDVDGHASHAWAHALMEGHGYRAVHDRYTEADSDEVVWRYPANFPVLQAALGVIVRSEFSRTLARQWYGEDAAEGWEVIPLLRTPVRNEDRNLARQTLRLAADDLLICSFGVLGPHKLNDRLLDAWLASPLAHDPAVHLVFVGENHGGSYGLQLAQRIRDCGLAKRVRITGWVDSATYYSYLAAADVAVQLRTFSRVEASAAVLDCISHGLATIVNAKGSMVDLDSTSVWMLPDVFTDEMLIDALTLLTSDESRRRAVRKRAQEVVHTNHGPRVCAEQYFESIERMYRYPKAAFNDLLNCLTKLHLPEQEWPSLANNLARSFPPALRRPQLLVDVSELVQRDAKSGIQRVVRAILREWLANPPEGFQVEPVYADAEQPGYRYARQWTSHFLGMPSSWANDDPVEAWLGDRFIGLDLQHHVVLAQRRLLQSWRDRGVRVWFVIYDLLPVLIPQVFSADAQAMHQHWLESVSRFDGVACISQSVAHEMYDWSKSYDLGRKRPLEIKWFHLGADVQRSVPTHGLPPDAELVLAQLLRRPTFLMVGTVEPRKGHAQVVEAFEQLWAQDIDVNLIIVGKQGWMVESLVQRIHSHYELNKRLFWLEGISDEYLEKVYPASTCLISASYGEGFGLPLIEAAQHKLPIIARDIPVFREVAGKHAFYFAGTAPMELARAIQQWLGLYASSQHAGSSEMPWLTWKESAAHLLAAVGIKSN